MSEQTYEARLVNRYGVPDEDWCPVTYESMLADLKGDVDAAVIEIDDGLILDGYTFTYRRRVPVSREDNADA